MVLQQFARDHDLLHLGRAFVDAQRPDLAIKLLDLDALLDAEAAVQLHGAIDDALRRLGRDHFRHRGLAGDARGALVLGPGGAIDQQRRGVDLAGAVGDRRLRHLQIAERGAEQPAACGMCDGLVQRPAGEAERGGAHGRAEHVERRHGDLEALARLAQPIGQRNAHALEPQGRERMRRDHLDAFRHRAGPAVSASTTNAESPLAPAPSPVRAKTT